MTKLVIDILPGEDYMPGSGFGAATHEGTARQDHSMPKAFTPTEKKRIEAALKRAGLARFARQGIRATRVGDICADVGIAKGSFYAFFASKEDLFMGLADERDRMHKHDMRRFVEDADMPPARLLGEFFDFLMERVDTDPILKILRDTGEISHLTRKVSPELVADNTRRDREFMIELSGLLRERHHLPAADTETLTGLMTLMISLSMQTELISAAADYAGIVRLLRGMFIDRLLKGPSS